MDIKYLWILLIIGLPFGLSAQKITRGPYLQIAGDTQIEIKWRTSSKTKGKVWYGTSLSSLNKNKSSKSEINHSITIKDLSPNTKYYYAIGDSDGKKAGEDKDHYFITSPKPETPKKLKAWILGDSGTGDERPRGVRDAYIEKYGQKHADMIIMLGDNAYSDGKDDEYQDAVFEDMYEDFLRNTPLWTTPGNHDLRKGLKSPYFDIFSMPTQGEAGGIASGAEQYYSFDYGNIHFVSLDTQDESSKQGSAMMDWLEEDLAATNQDWIIAFWHHPPYSFGSHDSDNEGALTRPRENIVPIMEKYGVDLVLTGHSHNYERSYLVNGHYEKSTKLKSSMILDKGDGQKDGDGAYEKATSGSQQGKGAVYVVAGSSGKISKPRRDGRHPIMHKKLMELGSVVLEIEGNELDLTFINDDGAVRDYLTLRKKGLNPEDEDDQGEDDDVVDEEEENDDDNNDNTPARWDTKPVLKVNPGQKYQYNFDANDNEGDRLSYKPELIPKWLSYSRKPKYLKGTPSKNDVGLHEVSLSADDGSGKVFQNFTIQVGDTPIIDSNFKITSIPLETISERRTYYYRLKTNQNSNVTYKLKKAPSWLKVSGNLISGYVNQDRDGTYDIEVDAMWNGQTTTQRYELKVTNINRAPYFITKSIGNAVVGRDYQTQIKTADQDEEKLTCKVIKKPSWLSISSSCNCTGKPKSSDKGQYSVEIEVSDESDEKESKTFQLKVLGESQVAPPPAFVSQPPKSTLEDQQFVYYIQSNYNPQDMIISELDLPGWLSYSVEDQALKGIPDQAEVGSHQITLGISHQFASTDTQQQFELEVINVNDAPGLLKQPQATFEEDVFYQEQLLFNDQDGDWIAVTLMQGPSWLSLSKEDRLVGTPRNEDVGTHSVSIAFDDGHIAAPIIYNYELDVKNVNDRPQFTNSPITSHFLAQHFMHTIEFEDPDVNDQVTVSVAGLPSSLFFNEKTNEITGTFESIGDIQWTQILTDNSGAQSVQEVSIEVQAGLKLGEKVKAFPNPFLSELNLIVELESKQNVLVEIYGLDGKRVSRKKFSQQAAGVSVLKLDDLESLKPQVYLIRAKIDSKWQVVRTVKGELLK